MSVKPTRAIPVRNLAESLEFFVEKLGLKLVQRYPDAAHLETAFGHILLAGPGAGEVAPYMAPTYETLKPGAVIYLFAPDIEAVARRLPEATLVRTDWGERKLELPDPNGYTVSFWTESDLTPEQTLALFRSVPDRLEQALAGLTDSQLDLAQAPGKWSIRQIVHHITDAALSVVDRLRYAVAEPGRLYHLNVYDANTWDRGLCSARRPVGPSVALFRAVHEHMLQLVEYVPDALGRYTVNEAGARAEVGQVIGMLVAHSAGHVDQIWQTRRVHGV